MELQLLICIVKDDDAVDEILTGFVELGIGGGTVITARGMAEIISAQVPLFAGFRDVFQAGGTSRIILAAMPSKTIPHAQRLIEDLLHTESGNGPGVCFAVPISSEVGLRRQIIDDD